MTDSTDLVGRLKAADKLYRNSDVPYCAIDELDALLEEAAAEVERLRSGAEATAKMYDALMKAKESYRAEAHRNGARALASESKLREIEAETREACAKIAKATLIARVAYFDRAKAHRDWTDASRSYRASADEVATAIRSHASQGEKK